MPIAIPNLFRREYIDALPLFGLLVDSVGNFSPVGIVGACIAVAILVAYRDELKTSPASASA